MESTVVIGYSIFGLVLTLAGFIPALLAWYKKNTNATQIYKANPIIILGLGAVGLILAMIFQAAGTDNTVWAPVILIVIEVLRLAGWGYLLYMAIKDKDLPIF